MYLTMLAVALETRSGDLYLHVAHPGTPHWLHPAEENKLGELPTGLGRAARYEEFSPGDAERKLVTAGWEITGEEPGALGAWTEHASARAYTAPVQRELWPISKVADFLGYEGPSATGSARRWLSRKDIKAEARGGGRGGEAHYPAHEVRKSRDASPGKGRHGAPRLAGGRFTASS